MSAAGTMTWEMDGFRVIRTSPRIHPRPVVKPAALQGSEFQPVPGQTGSRHTDSHGRAPQGVTRPRGAERALEADWQIVVQRCLDGDSGAWSELVKFHHRRIYALCYRFTGSSHDAEDLTQDVFIKVYGNLASFDLTRGSFQTWITTLARNLLVDHFRRSKQQRVTDSMDAGWEETEELPLSDRLAASGPSQHDRAAQKEIARMVQEALTKISPELREAVILRDLQDMDYKEIAQVLRIPEGTVKSRISRGRAELARLLERNKGQVV
ncbi:RNA polymerase sigma-70 factor (ECF subfamily) [Silvibacterium bohemicum]|uniref:RNA polymerase sigma-70 factor (ECF subfamily) n=1 Tax=Silvibacterium bohemicum TaxID=1577686 RepID=A0A841JX39_9BACT|nr:RNA polymerase sigma factor [Silvibacterium bohemicum]MBB6145916.1 RNA polymerase sigma-70 factor (ECF subfamily) [Silvibacterium bohemicum]